MLKEMKDRKMNKFWKGYHQSDQTDLTKNQIELMEIKIELYIIKTIHILHIIIIIIMRYIMRFIHICVWVCLYTLMNRWNSKINMDEEKISELKTDMKESFRMQHKKPKKK